MSDFILTYLLAIGLTAIPIVIWLAFIFSKTKRKGLQIALFLLNFLTVVPVFLLQYVLSLYPQFDLVKEASNYLHDEKLLYAITFICVGVVEELVKQMFIRFIDKKYLLIKSVNESIKYSLIGALGFSFIENVIYMYVILQGGDLRQIVSVFLFRTLITTCAHMIFSGFFGYYYGVAKFIVNLSLIREISSSKHYISEFISHRLGVSPMQTLKQLTILKGLLIAITLHATFNYLLQYNQIAPAALLIFVAFAVLVWLLKLKMGNLLMIMDLESKNISVMDPKDEQVVLEVIAMWYKQKKYVSVINTCKRLLERDPDNKMAQVFLSRCSDKMAFKNKIQKIMQNVFKKQKKL